MSNLPSDVGVYHNEHLRQLSEAPNTTVYTVAHDAVHEPWPPARLKRAIETLTRKVTEFGSDADDFVVRKECLKDPEVLAFQRDHPRTYWMLTDRALANNPQAKQALIAMLHVHARLRANEITEQEADAAATSAVVQAFAAGGPSPAPS